jgi:microcystin-dependent protein
MPTPLPARNIFDGTALPVTSTMKTSLGALRDYLADLLGTTGTAVDARTAMGAASSGANSDITSLSAVTSLSILPPGMLLDYAGGSAPMGYLLCDGSAVSRTTYSALYAALGGAASAWGQGNGTTTFNVPDLRRKTTIGSGGTAVSGPANTVGATGGAETHTLSTAELAAHNHVINISDPGHKHTVLLAVTPGVTSTTLGTNRGDGNNNNGFMETNGGNPLGTGITATSNNNGSGTAHNNMPPSVVVTKIIKT